MTASDLRAKYHTFIYDSFSHWTKDAKQICEYKYSLPPDHTFTHTITFDNLSQLEVSDLLVFQLGLAEMFSYWKLTCSPTIEIAAGHLTPNQIEFWHKLFIRGMGQYFYENKIDFTSPDFLKIYSTGNLVENSKLRIKDSAQVLVPLGGGKDSIVTAELLKKDFILRPIIVYPASPASLRITNLLGFPQPILVSRILDPHMLQLTKEGYLTGHVPYSAVLAFIFLLAAAIEGVPYIAVSNEASSSEGNLHYLGHAINHQYSKSIEFETDFNKYLHDLEPSISYFSFLRPLHELQIAKLFSHMSQYFTTFRSCNKNQQLDSWCGHCPKCISIAMTLMPWTSDQTVMDIMGTNPIKDPSNAGIITSMTDPTKIKPFECVTTTEEAQICLEFIDHGPTPRVQEFLAHWDDSPNTPPHFADTLESAYYRT